MRMRFFVSITIACLVTVAFADQLPISVILSHKALREPGMSMEPEIAPGDVVYVNTSYFARNQPKPGEIVAFRDSTLNGSINVKRIVALGGSTVQIKGAALIVDGHTIAEPYFKQGGATTPYSLAWGPKKLPVGCIFLLGDYRDHSQDSRGNGCYAAGDLVGLVEYVAPSGNISQARKAN